MPVFRQVPYLPAYIKTGDALLSVKSFRRTVVAVSREEFDRSPVSISRPRLVAILRLAAFLFWFFGTLAAGQGNMRGVLKRKSASRR